MAKNIADADGEQKPTSENVTATHNVEHRKEVIRKSLEEVASTDDEIERLTALHIAPLREANSKVRKRLREDFGMPAKVFNSRYALYRMERRAIRSEDGPTLDALQEMMEIAPPGTQLDWLDAVTKADEKQATDQKAPSKKAAGKRAASASA